MIDHLFWNAGSIIVGIAVIWYYYLSATIVSLARDFERLDFSCNLKKKKGFTKSAIQYKEMVFIIGKVGQGIGAAKLCTALCVYEFLPGCFMHTSGFPSTELVIA